MMSPSVLSGCFAWKLFALWPCIIVSVKGMYPYTALFLMRSNKASNCLLQKLELKLVEMDVSYILLVML